MQIVELRKRKPRKKTIGGMSESGSMDRVKGSFQQVWWCVSILKR